jgi:hypothetical protein
MYESLIFRVFDLAVSLSLNPNIYVQQIIDQHPVVMALAIIMSMLGALFWTRPSGPSTQY